MRTEIIGTIVCILFTIVSIFMTVVLKAAIPIGWWWVFLIVVVLANMFIWALVLAWAIEKFITRMKDEDDT